MQITSLRRAGIRNILQGKYKASTASLIWIELKVIINVWTKCSDGFIRMVNFFLSFWRLEMNIWISFALALYIMENVVVSGFMLVSTSKFVSRHPVCLTDVSRRLLTPDGRMTRRHDKHYHKVPNPFERKNNISFIILYFFWKNICNFDFKVLWAIHIYIHALFRCYWGHLVTLFKCYIYCYIMENECARA